MLRATKQVRGWSGIALLYFAISLLCLKSRYSIYLVAGISTYCEIWADFTPVLRSLSSCDLVLIL